MVARFDFIVASLEKAGVPPEELHHFKQVVSRLPLAKATAIPDDDTRQYPEVVAEGVLEKLQGGTQGFAPVWKSRWIRISPGELQVFESAQRPEHPDTPCLFCLPLSVQQTRIDPGKTWGRQETMAQHFVQGKRAHRITSCAYKRLAVGSFFGQNHILSIVLLGDWTKCRQPANLTR